MKPQGKSRQKAVVSALRIARLVSIHRNDSMHRNIFFGLFFVNTFCLFLFVKEVERKGLSGKKAIFKNLLNKVFFNKYMRQK